MEIKYLFEGKSVALITERVWKNPGARIKNTGDSGNPRGNSASVGSEISYGKTHPTYSPDFKDGQGCKWDIGKFYGIVRAE